MVSTILNFFTGKAWQVGCIALGALLLSSGVYILSLHVSLSSKEAMIKTLSDELTKKEATIKEQMQTIANKRTEIELQNAVIESQRVDFEVKLIEAQKAKANIKERYKVIYKTIDTYKGDTNATSCDNAREFLNRFTW